ncbi:MAG: RsmD family RNA methyltransferase [Prevotellaceae bacterium]|jgi:16S rRNA (guanine(966)-N(2))-methyltransferase RsmD|nr:RsmD family RNA methyltransferase [Prevotellaceae bacterium]
MRIISGIYKGRRLNVPGAIVARPTTDFAKEGLFNYLNNIIDFEEVALLDLFAGTGSISYEFLSRGCTQAVAVELHKIQYDFIVQTKKTLNINNLLVFRADVFKFLKTCKMTFDVIFADPPYSLNDLEKIPDSVLNANLLTPNGVFILEHSANYRFENHPLFDCHRKYGNVNFSFFRKKDEN